MTVFKALSISVRENVRNLSKSVKNHVFFGFSKKRKKRNHLVMQPLIILNYRKLVPVSHGRSPTSNILLRSVDTRNYATENCV